MVKGRHGSCAINRLLFLSFSFMFYCSLLLQYSYSALSVSLLFIPQQTAQCRLEIKFKLGIRVKLDFAIVSIVTKLRDC
jgi:hypothetical protein